MFASLCKVCAEARKTVTAWVGVAISVMAYVAENVETIYQQVPSIEPYLPKSHYVHTGLHYVMVALGILVGVMRVRRMVWPKAHQ